MFKNTYQNGLLSIFYSCGSNPLAIWDMEVKNGHVKRLTDPEVNSIVLEIVSTNVATTYITCPRGNQTLGIKLPFLVMIVKNLKRYFSFEITILDDKNMRRRFRISNFQSTTKIKPFCTSMPIGLSGGWNQIQFNLADFTRRAYGSQFLETIRVQIHANVRLRRIYFSERLYTEEELPQDYKLFLPLDRKLIKKSKDKKPEDLPVPPMAAATPPPLKEEVPLAKVASVEAPLVEAPAERPPSRKVTEVTVTPASTEAGDENSPEYPEDEQPPQGDEHAAEGHEHITEGNEPAPEGEEPATHKKTSEDEGPVEEPPAEEVLLPEE